MIDINSLAGDLASDLAIAVVLLNLRGRVRNGGLFLSCLMLFSILPIFLLFLRGDVPTWRGG